LIRKRVSIHNFINGSALAGTALEFMKLCILTLFLAVNFRIEALAEQKLDSKLPFKVPASYKALPEAAQIVTTKGSLLIKFYRQETPISVANFEHLVKKKILEETIFHRYTPGFALQGGDPTKTGKGGPGWQLPPEFSTKIKHKIGTLGWASLPAEVNPERLSNGSQFYIMLRDAPDLDRYYTAFAQVVRGLKTLEKLRKGDKILEVILNPSHRKIEGKIEQERQNNKEQILDKPIELNRDMIQQQDALKKIIENKNEHRR